MAITPTSSRRPTMVQTASPSGTAGPSINGRRVSRVECREDEGLVMREKEKGEGSIGKAGGVGVGVTRPKRRLSRALSVTASPPLSPLLPNPNGHAHHQPHSTYHALQNPLSGNSVPLQHQTHGRVNSWLRNDEKNELLGTGKDGSPTLFGVELKWISLITLALQNAFLTIIMHYSRISSHPNKTYSAASAVLLNELLKGSVSIIIALRKIDADLTATPQPHVYFEKHPRDPYRGQAAHWTTIFHPTRIQNLSKQVFSPDCYKLSVPAILYVIQNNLQYVAASNLDVATFQVTYQMKILTTAFFSVLLLGRRLSRGKWASLIMLAIGVGIVQIQSSTVPAPRSLVTPHINKGSAQLRSDIPEIPTDLHQQLMHPFRGFMAVTLACLTSGLAGVYFEFILKSSSGSTPAPDLWIRNTQLSLFSLVPALVPIVFSRAGPDGVGWVGRMMMSFSNFNGWALGTVLTQTLGGLITAVVIRYSDNIMKGFATSLSIIISFLASVALFSYPITLAFVIGSSIVLAATYLYNLPSSSSSPSTRKEVAVAPGSPILTSAPILGEPERPSRASSVINLLGLGSQSRKPSTTDLRRQNGVNLAFTPHQHSQQHPGFYSASAPGTPYLSSAYPSSTNVMGNPYENGSTSSRGSPSLGVRGSPNLGLGVNTMGPGMGMGLGAPPRRPSSYVGLNEVVVEGVEINGEREVEGVKEN